MQNPYSIMTATIVNLLWLILGSMAYMIGKQQKKQADYYNIIIAFYIFSSLSIDTSYVLMRELYNYYPFNINFLRKFYVFDIIQWETGFFALILLILVSFFMSSRLGPIHFVSASIGTASILTYFSWHYSLDYLMICFGISIINFILVMIMAYCLVNKKKFVGIFYLFILLFSFNDFMLYLWSLNKWFLFTGHITFLLIVINATYLAKFLYNSCGIYFKL